jgi:streptogramin lyase
MTASIRLLRSLFASICTPFTLRLGSVTSLFFGIGAACVLSAGAQTAASYREGFEVLGGQQTYPSGIAVDTNGNVYLAMTALSTVEKIPASCINGANNASCVITLGGGFSDPLGVAVDVNGNVYVADTDNDAIKEIPASCIAGANDASCVFPLGSGFKEPYGVAVDGSGNVYVADTFKSAVKMITASCVANAPGVPCTVSSSVAPGAFAIPSGIAVDASGNVYVADAGFSTVREVPAACISGANDSGCTSTIGAGFDTPYGVAVDGSGDVYVADAGNNTVSEIPASCIAGANDASCMLALGGDFDTPYGVAAGTGGVVYVADTSNWEVKEFWPQGVDFGAVAVATISPATRTLDFYFTSGGTIGAPAVLTGGVAGLDFTDAGTGSCTSQGTGHAYSVGDVCTVDVNLKPQYPGVRNGAVLLEDNMGNVLAMGYIHGIGSSPQITFADITTGNYVPGTVATLGGGLSSPLGLAVDGSGNVFVADNGNNAVKEIAYSCGSAACPTALSGNFSSATDVAVDGAGNLYVADTGNGAVKEIPQGCTVLGCVQTLGGGFTAPEGVTVDGNGNVYVADNTTGGVMEIPAGCADSSCVTTVATGFSNPQGVALDGYGDVFVTDGSANKVTEIAPSCANFSCGTALGGGFVSPGYIAVDASGNVFVADPGLNGVREIPAGCVSSACVLPIGSGFTSPHGVALNGSGNLYVSDASGSVVTLLDFVDPPSLTFATTSIGFTSADSPQTVLVLNDGNQSLNFTALSMPSDFVLNSSGGGVCSSSTMLAADAFCTLPIDFTPLNTGSLSENLTLTENNLNASGAQHSIPLSSTGNPAPDTTTTSVSISPGTFQSGQTTTVTATVTDTGVRATTPTGSVTFSWTCSGICGYDTNSSSNSASGTLNSGNPVNLVDGVATLAGVSFSTAGTYTVTASYSGVSETFQTSSNGGQQSDGNNQATVSWSPAAPSVPAPSSLGSVNLGSSANQTVTFTFAAAGTIGVPVVVTEGAAGKDFTDVGDGTCTTQNGSSFGYNAGDTCTVDVQFAPQYPGMVPGAVILEDVSGNVLATTYLSGTGTGPQINFSPGTLSPLAPLYNGVTPTTGLSSPAGVAIDGAGNIFLADTANNAVKEFTFASGYTAVNVLAPLYNGSTPTTGFNQPNGLAVDGAGNVFVADSGNNAIKEISFASGYTAVNVLAPAYNGGTPSTGFNAPFSVAVDLNGNVFVADSGNLLVKEIPVAGGYSTVDTLAVGYGNFSPVFGVAVDQSSNVFVAGGSTNPVLEIAALGGYTTVTAVAPAYNGVTPTTGFSTPQALAVDRLGNLFVADSGNNAVKEITSASAYTTVNMLNGSLNTPEGVAVGGNGNVFVGDTNSNAVREFDLADVPSLSFATTAVGLSSTDSPQTVTVTNDGNASLIFSGLTTGTDFPLDSTGGPVCSSSTTLVAGATCTLPIDFTPLGSSPYSTTSLSESLTLTDNSMNVSSATQPIALSGTGIAPTITFSSPASTTLTAGTVGAAYSVSFQATGGAGPYSYSATVPPGLSLSSAGLLSGTPTAVENAYSITVTATDANGFSASQGYSLTIGQGTATFDITPYSVTYDTNSHTATGTATGWSGLDLSAGLTLTGTTHTSAGTYASDAWSFHDATGNYADASGTVSDQIAQATATIVITGYTVNFDGSPHSATGTATGVGGANLGGDLNLSGTVHTSAGNYASDAWSFTDPNGNYAPASSTVSDTINILTATATATAAASFGSVSTGSSTTQTVTFTIQTAGAIGAPVVVTQGATGLDFTDAGDGSCTLNNGTSNGYAAGATCTVDVSFAPQVPGTRTGAVLLQDGSGNTLATAYVYGVGSGPEIGFLPGTQSTLTTNANGLGNPQGVALDGSGNLYIADSLNQAIWQTTPGGTTTKILDLSGVGIGASPETLAVDGAGNLYIADSGNSTVWQATPSGSGYVLNPTAVVSGLNAAGGVAVDQAGNVYVANSGGNQILMETLQTNGSYAQSTIVNNTDMPLGTALNTPMGVAVDLSGNVYISDTYNNRVIRETWSGSSWTPALVAGGLDWPVELTVDANGNVYFANNGHNAIADAGVYKETLQPDSSYMQSVLPTALASANVFGLALDGSGNLYIADTTDDQAVKVNYATATALSFAATAVGFTSTDSPQTLTVNNNGNAALNFSGVSTPTDFPLATSGGNVCSSTTTLAANTSCALPIDFTPAATNAGFDESLTLTDNSLNVSSANQLIAVSAAGIAPTITFSAPASTTLTAGTVGVAYSVSFQATGGASPYAYSATVPPGLSLSSAGLLSGTPTAVESAYSITVTATDANGFTGSQNYSLTIGQGTATFDITPYSVTYDANPHTAAGTATGWSGLDLSAGLTLTGTTHTNAGTYASDAWSFHDATGNYADASGAVSDQIAQATASFSVPGYNVTYDANPHTSSGTATGVSGADLSAGLTLTGTTHTNAGTYASDAWSFHDATGNYADASGTASDQIVQAMATILVSGYAVNYDGNPHSATATATGVSAADLSADVNLTGTAHTSVGSYTDPWSFTDPTGNYASAGGTVSDSVIQVTAAVTTPAATNFGAQNLGTPSTQFVTFTFQALGSIGTPVVVTEGAPGLDFSDAGDGSCNTNGVNFDYSVSATCTVDVRFSPQYPGTRSGAALLEDGSGNILATAYVSGVGTGPMINFSPSAASTLNSNFTTPHGVAADASGNIYLADSTTNLVEQIAPGCTTSGCLKTLGGGFSQPQGVAIDGAGNVYIADSGNSAIKEIPASCIAGADNNTCVLTLGGGFSQPAGVAVDASGNVYVADTVNNAVEEMTPGCASAGCVTALGVGYSFNRPGGVAVDGSGNVYVADANNGTVEEMTAACTSSACVTVLGGPQGSSGFSTPLAVAVDGNGNVYVADGFEVKVMPSGCPTSACVGNTGGNFSTLYAVALDQRGDILVADSGRQSIDELDYADAPSLSFNTVVAGATSSDSPKTVTVTNAGNGQLSFSGVSAPTDFPLAASGGSVCSSTTTLAGNASCTLPIDFTPTTNTLLNESLTLDDNSLLAASPIQTIAVTGTGTTPTITFTLPAGTTLPPATVGVPYSGANFQATGGASPYAYSGTMPAGLTLSSDGALSGIPAVAGTSISITVLATDKNGFTGSQNYTISVGKGVASFSITPYTETYDGNPHTATGTATGDNDADLSAGLTLTGTTHTNAGNYATDTWTFHDANGNYADATGTVSDTIAKASATVNINSYSAAYDGNAHTATGTAFGVGGADLSSDLNLTGTTHINAGTYTTDAWTFSDASGNYQNATGTVTDVISKASATIKVTPYDVSYDGNAHTATGTATGAGGVVLSDGDVVLTGTSHTNPGIYASDAWSFSDPSGNYQIASGTVSDTINEGTGQVTLGGLAQTYTGSPLAATATTTPPGLTVNLTYTGTGGTVYSQSATAPTLAGSYTVAGTISSTDYTGASSGTLVISRAASQVTTLISNLNPAAPGGSVTLTATVASAAGTPTGTVTFMDSTNTILGTATLGSGQAALTASFTAAQAGANPITAIYGGDSNFLGSTGGSLTETVTVITVAPGSGSSTTQTVAPGGTATYGLNLAPTSGTSYPAPVTLSLSGLPTGATATITPATWTQLTGTTWSFPANTALTAVTLSIQVPSTTAKLDQEKTNGTRLPPVLWGMLLLPFAIKLRRAGKRMRSTICLILLMVASAAAMTALGGCSSGGSSGSSTPQQGTSNYTITVTTTSGTASSNTTLYLTVN